MKDKPNKVSTELDKMSVKCPEKLRPYYDQDGITIYHGDCLEIMPQFPDKSFDLVVTSPPYDNLRTYEGITWNENIWKSIIKDLFRIVKQGGVVVWVVGDATIKGSETGTSFKQALYFKDIGFRIHDTMIYRKHSFSKPVINRYHQVFEYMFVFSKGNPKTFNPIKDKKNKCAGRTPWDVFTARQKDGSLKKRYRKNVISEYGKRYNVWKYLSGGGHSSKDKIAYEHPAIFPEKLARDHIVSWSNVGDIVYDPLMGSGTTLVAAYKLGRKAVGIEINQEYCDIAVERIKKEIAQQKLF